MVHSVVPTVTAVMKFEIPSATVKEGQNHFIFMDEKEIVVHRNIHLWAAEVLKAWQVCTNSLESASQELWA